MTNPLTPAVRRWLYGVTIAALPVAVLLGWLDPEALPVLVPLVVAVLNVTPEEAGDE